MYKKSLDNLTIRDNFIFGAVMRNPKKCKAVIECILGIKIREIKYPELEKTINKVLEAKSIRLDVYVEDEADTIYNIELQITDRKNLPKRTRYYQGMIDLNIIDKGEDYNKLKKSFVIFICDYDEFGLGRHIYTFEKICKEDSKLSLGDETTIVVLNTKGKRNDVKDYVKEFLEYIGGAEPRSSLTRSLDKEVERIKASEEWRREYMTMKMLLRENRNIGKTTNLVSLIRDVELDDIDVAVKFLKTDKEYILYVKNVIKEHPELDDEEIAELIIE